MVGPRLLSVPSLLGRELRGAPTAFYVLLGKATHHFPFSSAVGHHAPSHQDFIITQGSKASASSLPLLCFHYPRHVLGRVMYSKGPRRGKNTFILIGNKSLWDYKRVVTRCVQGFATHRLCGRPSPSPSPFAPWALVFSSVRCEF